MSRLIQDKRASARRLVAALLAGLAPACDVAREKPARRVDLEGHLRQQVADLQSLVERAERRALVPTDGLVVVVHEDVVRQMARLMLPRETVVTGGFRVRLESLDVDFRDKHGAVRLDGRVTRAAGDLFDADVEARLIIFARFDAIDFDATTGTLQGRVAPIGFEIERLDVAGEQPLLRRFVEGLARWQSEALAELAFTLTIPVGFEPELRLGGQAEGPVRVRAASSPLVVTVRDVAAHGRRLWILLGIEVGPWQRTPPEKGR
jgi:hypothetical protein